MKARVKQTGEIIEIINRAEHGYEDSEHRQWYEGDLDFSINELTVDWQSVLNNMIATRLAKLNRQYYDYENDCIKEIKSTEELVNRLKNKYYDRH